MTESEGSAAAAAAAEEATVATTSTTTSTTTTTAVAVKDKHALLTKEDAEKLDLRATGGEDGVETKNACGAWCRRCGCSILSPNSAVLVRRHAETLTEDLLFLRAQTPEHRDEGLVCWHLADMYDFLNIGFTRTTKKLSGEEALQKLKEQQEKNGTPSERPVRYLTCADCEKEVLGFQYLDEPKDFYLLANRVLYEKPARK